ncbi:MAG: restriction endonuclease, partial [Gemmatimonadaceae bacterium]|nr:restriction endonuclease [Gemmatimonadaceae bacterium]
GAPKGKVKKGADRGIDGRLTFRLDDKGKYGTVLISVKGGHVHAHDVRDLRGTVEREKAAGGVLLSLEPFSKPMRTEAAAAGFFETPWGKYPRLQLLTVAELLAGARVQYPTITQGNVTFKRAAKVTKGDAPKLDLFGDA